jgi:hypothetical protein
MGGPLPLNRNRTAPDMLPDRSDTQPGLFQDRPVRLRMVKGRCIKRPAHRVASVMSVRPMSRSSPMARFRRPAVTLGPDLDLAWEASSQ